MNNMDRNEYRLLLERAVENTHEKFPNFLGAVIFGSFVTDKPEPNDLDMIPVMQKYDGNWDFSPVSEDDSHDDHSDYYEFTNSEDYFLSHFPIIFTKEEILSRGIHRNKQKGLHYERLIALNDPVRLKKWLDHYSANPENFVGDEVTKKRLIEICGLKVK